MKIATIACIGLIGCKTTRTAVEAEAQKESGAQMDMRSWKGGTTQREVLTYRPDGSLYRLEQVREYTEQTKQGKIRVQEKQRASSAELTKTKGPGKTGLHLMTGLAILAVAWWYFKFKGG